MAFGLSRKDLSIILLAIALAAVLTAQWLQHHEPAPPPRTPPQVDTKALEETLNKVAAETLAAPSLSNEEIIIQSAPAEQEKRQQEIVDLAEKLGGQALKVTNNGQRKVVARLPAARTVEFREQLGQPAGTAPTEDPWIEILLQP